MQEKKLTGPKRATVAFFPVRLRRAVTPVHRRCFRLWIISYSWQPSEMMRMTGNDKHSYNKLFDLQNELRLRQRAVRKGAKGRWNWKARRVPCSLSLSGLSTVPTRNGVVVICHQQGCQHAPPSARIGLTPLYRFHCGQSMKIFSQSRVLSIRYYQSCQQ